MKNKSPLLFALFVFLIPFSGNAQPQKEVPSDYRVIDDLPKVGIVVGLEFDSLAHASGFKYICESAVKRLSPKQSAGDLKRNIQLIKTATCKVLTCNLFFPGTVKIAGPQVVEREVLKYADSVLSAANKAGVKYIVLGSGGARRIPSGYDMGKAKAEFVLLSKKLAILAYKHDIIIVLENLEASETNFLTSLKESAEIVRKVDHPSFRLNADIFHMMREGEPPEYIIAAGGLISYCEVAEKEKRSLPGVAGDDFTPYLKALKQIGYKGYIFIEGSTNDPSVDIPRSYTQITKQISAVYTAP